jgi:hypothetical protein
MRKALFWDVALCGFIINPHYVKSQKRTFFRDIKDQNEEHMMKQEMKEKKEGQWRKIK